MPTPVPRELECIRDRNIRMKLWREITRNLSDQYNKFMPSALVGILDRYQLLRIQNLFSTTSTAFVRLEVDDLRINVYFYAINGDIRPDDIDAVVRLSRERPPKHCFVLLYTGDVPENSQHKISDCVLGEKGENAIQTIHIHPTLAKRIISIHRAYYEFKNLVDENLLMPTVKKLVTQELDFVTKMRVWLSAEEKRGIVVRGILPKSTGNLREFASTLRFYVNFSDLSLSPDEAFMKNRDELLRFFVYESKIGFIPDIELPKFKEITEDLQTYQFLEQVRGKFKIQLHPVEERILTILEREAKLSDEELDEYFVLENPRFLKDIFIPVLDYRGLVSKKGNVYYLTDMTELLQDVERAYSDLVRRMERKDYLEYGYIYTWKKKGDYRFFYVGEFLAYVNHLYEDTSQRIHSLNKEVVLQRLSLLSKLIEYFEREYIPILTDAIEASKKEMQNIRNQHSIFQENLNYIKEYCDSWLRLKFETASITEYREFQKQNERAEKAFGFGDEDIRKLIVKFTDEDKSKFYFRNAKEEAFFFNPKFFEIQQGARAMEDVVRRHDGTMTTIRRIFQELEQRRSEIKNRLFATPIEEGYRVSVKIKDILGSLLDHLLPETQPMSFETISLVQIEKFINENKTEILKNLTNLSDNVFVLSDVLEVEKTYFRMIGEALELEKHIADVFDEQEPRREADRYKVRMAEIQKSHETTLRDLSLKDARSLVDQTKWARSQLNMLVSEIKAQVSSAENIWGRYSSNFEGFVEDAKVIIQLVTNKGYQIDFGNVNEAIDAFEQILALPLAKLDVKLSSISKMRFGIQERFYDKVRSILTNEELDVLQLVISTLRTNKKEWISDNELFQVAERYLKIDGTKWDSILKKLVEERLLRPGISLAF